MYDEKSIHIQNIFMALWQLRLLYTHLIHLDYIMPLLGTAYV